MLSTRLLAGLLTAAALLAPATAHAAAKPWQAKWQFTDVDLDGTTTASYAEGDRSYVVDGASSYDSYKPGGFMDLRAKAAAAPGLFMAKATPLEHYEASKATYRERDRTVDCSAKPRKVATEALAAVVQVKGGRAEIQWSIAPTTQHCAEPIEQLDSTPLSQEAMTSRHPLSAFAGRTATLRVNIDETVKDPSGSLRVQWKGTVKLRRAGR
ncbi:MAG TPA: hypothetical protein VN238_16595 [Solirubrobacteraceae bacterium]|nr:hypothetical protein [Solirubrobacteraceae bacterium]